MKEEKYMILCDALNMADKNGGWSLRTNQNGALVFDGEIKGEKVQVPADLMLRLAEMKANNEEHISEL